MRTRPTRKPESGFALLMIFAMAAIIAITLYQELPRVAFEAQRDKEQLLIDRGEEYSRAVMLYVRKFNRYPADVDAMQNTQNLRFLRRKYVDPMTGKDDWRFIHVGPGGVFTDSLLYTKKKDPNKPEAQSFITEIQQTAPTVPAQGGVNIATRQRPSDQPGAPGDPNNPAGANNGPVQVLPDGRIVPVSQTGQAVPNQAAPGQPFPNQGFPNQGFPNQGFPNQGFPNQGFPNQGFPNQAAPNQGFPTQSAPTPSGSPFPGSNTPPGGFQGGFPGQQPNSGPGAAANLINQILTTPRPGGLNGLPGQPGQQGQPPSVDQSGNPLPNGGPFGTTPNAAPTGVAGNNTGTPPPAAQGQTIGGGIAGVASKLEQDGVKVYRDRTSYNEWEFVYDITKDSARGGGAGAAQTANPAQNGNATQNGNAASSNNGSPFSNSTFPTGAAPANPNPATPGR